MTSGSARERAMAETRERILEAARELLGNGPDAGMAAIAAAAGVVRRTVYGHFPSRGHLVRAIAERAASDIEAVVEEVESTSPDPAAAWAEFVDRLWPLARQRYRVLLVLRRGEYGDEIHALLRSVDDALAGLVRRGQDARVFGRHLPAGALARIAYAAVFTIADDAGGDEPLDVEPAIVTSLLILGVPGDRAHRLAAGRPSRSAHAARRTR